MLVSRTVAARNIAPLSHMVPMQDVAIKTRLGFSNPLETMFAMGVVDALLQRGFDHDEQEVVLSHSRGTEHHASRHAELVDLRWAVQKRQWGLRGIEEVGDADPLLTDEQSGHLRHTLDWGSSRHQKEAADKSHDGFRAVVAGAMVLQATITHAKTISDRAGAEVLEFARNRGLFRKGLRLPDNVVSHALADDEEQPGSLIVTVVTEQELLAV